MAPSTKLDEKLDGAENFQAWKYRIMLILQENDLDEFVKSEVPEAEGEEVKAKFKKDEGQEATLKGLAHLFWCPSLAHGSSK